jgi:hypothetical protein
VQPENARPFDSEFRPKPQYSPIFRTKVEAEAEKERQRQRFGDRAAIHVNPVFPSGVKQRRLLGAAQENLTAQGWPVQLLPPRPGVPAKAHRK